ncbi:MAG: hypothetical protein J0M12_11020 [Deltaproteobacteria bacterium]|nr:hypothetical protein [Deltaproteobacteria bacterium]
MRITKTLIFSSVLLLLASCSGGTTVVAVDSNNSGHPDKDGQGSGITIVAASSRSTSLAENPSIARIEASDESLTLDDCEAVSIAEHTFLTAAHCVANGISKDSLVFNGTRYAISEVSMHPGFYDSLKTADYVNDVAVVHSVDLDLPALPILTPGQSGALTAGPAFSVAFDAQGESVLVLEAADSKTLAFLKSNAPGIIFE